MSSAGDGVLVSAVPLLAASLTRDPVAVAAVTAAQFVPALLIGLPAGAFADRWPRRTVMVAADLARATVLAAAAAAVAAGWMSVPVLVCVTLGLGIGRCLFDAAAQAALPSVVGTAGRALAKVNGRFWALDTAGRSLLGPPAGSVLYAAGAGLPFLADAVSFAVSAAAIRRLPNMPGAGQTGSTAAAVRDGIRYLAGSRPLLLLTAAAALMNAGSAAITAPLVLYAQTVLHVSDAGFGLLLAAQAVGGFAAGWWAAPLTRRLTPGQAVAAPLAVHAAAWTAILLVPHAWLAGVLLVAVGAGSSIGSTIIGATRQALTPVRLLGRVVTVSRTVGLGAVVVGAPAGGLLASAAGPGAPLAAGAAVLAVSAVLLWRADRNTTWT